MKKLYYLLLSLVLFAAGIEAQNCEDVTIKVVSTPSTCQSNGSITITFEGTSAAQLENKVYTISSGSIKIGPVSNNVFNNLPAGNYNIEAGGSCGSLTGPNVVRTATTTITGSYKEPLLTFIAPASTSNSASVVTSRNSYAGCSTGLIAVKLQNGNQTTTPTFTITEAPAGVSVPQVVTVTKATSGSDAAGWSYLLGGTWPAGTYKVQANDGCYTAVTSFNINELTTVPGGNSGYNYFSPYASDEPNCSKVNYYHYYNYDATNYPDWNRYANDGMYEYGLAPIGQIPTTENWFPVRYANGYTATNLFNLPGKLSDYYNSPNKLAVYTRLKNCTSVITSVTTYIMPPLIYTTTSDNSCEGIRTYTTSKYPSSYYAIYCYPLTIRITDQATGAVKYQNTNYLYSSPAVTTICNTNDRFYLNVTDANGKALVTNSPMTGIPATNAPLASFRYFYSYDGDRYCDYYNRYVTTSYPCDAGYPNPAYLKVTDNNGIVVWEDTFTNAVYKAVPNLKYGVKYTYTFTYPNYGDGKYTQVLTETVTSYVPTGFVLSKSSTSNCYDNRGVLMINASSPTGSGYIRTGTKITVTGPSGYVSQTYTATSQSSSISYYYSFPETYLPPGEYTATIESCGQTYIIKYPVQGGYTGDKLTYKTELDCMGTKIFPSGGISFNGTPIAQSSVYFRMMVAPTGSGATSKVIPATSNDYFSLTTPGTYILGMMTTNSLSGCAIKLDTINYNPQPLALDKDKTSGYACPGGTTGYLTLQASNGVLPYTYSVYDANNTLQLVAPITTANALNLGDFGVAGETYTIRMSDACGNSFNQQIKLSALDEVALAYFETNPACYNGPIILNAFTVTDATYSWTGPNGFTSSLKKPVIPNATKVNEGWYKVSITSIKCAITVRDSVYMKVYDPLSINDIIGKTIDVALCPYQVLSIGQVVTGGSSGSFTYQWQYNNNPNDPTVGTWYNLGISTPILTGSNTNFMYINTMATPVYRYLRVIISDPTCGPYYVYYRTRVKPCMFLVNPDLKSPGTEN